MKPYPLVGLNHFTVPVAIAVTPCLCASPPIARATQAADPEFLGDNLRAARTGELSKADRKLVATVYAGRGTRSMHHTGSGFDHEQRQSAGCKSWSLERVADNENNQ